MVDPLAQTYVKIRFKIIKINIRNAEHICKSLFHMTLMLKLSITLVIVEEYNRRQMKYFSTKMSEFVYGGYLGIEYWEL